MRIITQWLSSLKIERKIEIIMIEENEEKISNTISFQKDTPFGGAPVKTNRKGITMSTLALGTDCSGEAANYDDKSRSGILGENPQDCLPPPSVVIKNFKGKTSYPWK